MKSDMEHNEWADKEMSLERFSKENPFTVPSGYFEEAGQRILSLLKLDEFKHDDAAQGFTVPADYFEELSANIQSRINIEAVANTDEDGFTVPEGYFNQLTNTIQSRINIESAAGSNAEAFSVPAGYFDNLQQQITARIAVEEIADKQPGFTVPDGYFEKLNTAILNKTVNQEAVIRKTIVRKLWASNTFKYATAACLALIIGAGAFLRDVQQPVTHTQTFLHKQVSNIPVDEIKDYLELNIDANDTRGLMDNDKQINTDALDADLQEYIDIN
ncbi:hypothetical protein [Mucilaginibacter phyllosphaerae]|uniref:Uncharacterized protein n=1 Tax=Mucilaginibacter phyllosphaerae TaxID=1812349 RepID=A0A4Y8AK54_9SPHI|nr:hypothetical protein [Mucilaginibacter phyllosphaerae]MBB3967553.1 hypothetical protein [Mucilaginibacter phyllosphaerae]TEW69387.1 hypothetical protein E2R65_04245 [Mucilaginibacter phyllosphaerae]GGH21368.1 hypothetical protein GCM10007352_34030 [Mucilaginibacter phyllosphaerae]